MTRPVDRLDLGVTDLERSLAFYNGLLEPLGFTRNSEIVGGRPPSRLLWCGEPPGGAVFFCDPDGIKLEIVHRPAP